MNLKKTLTVVVLTILLVVGLITIPKLWEDVDAGEIVIIQDPFDGTLHVYKQPGFVWQGMGKVTHYKKSNQFWFLSAQEEGEVDQSIDVMWNDGAHAQISGSVRYDLPLDDVSMIKLHSTFNSQEGLETALIKTNIEKSIFLTGPLMSSKESYAEKKNDLIHYFEDQASKGVYRTRQREVKEIDELTKQEKTVTRVEIQLNSNGLPIRQEISPISLYKIRLYNISIKSITYSKDVLAQIKTQQQSIMSIQTAQANAKRAEQDAITAAKQGEADAAKAKWKQEVIKATLVTEAEQRNKVASLDVQTAELNKRKSILEGEGEAAKKRLIMQANGALEQKLDAWVKERKFAWEAFSKFSGNLVPLYQSGSSSQSNAVAWMEIMGVKAAKELTLDLKNK